MKLVTPHPNLSPSDGEREERDRAGLSPSEGERAGVRGQPRDERTAAPSVALSLSPRRERAGTRR